MNKFIIYIVFLVLNLVSFQAYAEETTVTFGILTKTNALSPSAIKAGIKPFENYLKSKLKINVVIKVLPDLESLETSFKNGSIEWAYASNLEYIRIKNKIDVTPVVKIIRGNTDKYNAIILVRKDSNINNIDELKGKTFAYSSKNSSHGFLYPSFLVKSKFNESFDSFFGKIILTKKDIDGIYSVYYKQADVTSSSDASYEIISELSPRINRNLKIISTSEPMIFGSVFYYDKNIKDKSLIKRVKQILLDMDKVPEGSQTLMSLKMSAWTEHTDADYNPIRKLLKQVE